MPDEPTFTRSDDLERMVDSAPNRSFERYLASKTTVDDRALNRHVLKTLEHALPAQFAKQPLRVIEVGAGIGTMVERLVDWGLLQYAHYTAVDAEPDNIRAARRRLARWSKASGLDTACSTNKSLSFRSQTCAISIELSAADIFTFIPSQRPRSWDFLLAHAFLDLVDLHTALPELLSLLRPEGIFYFTLNFDGETILEPAIDPNLDSQIVELYHHTMNTRTTLGRPSGDSRTGRHLFHALHSAGADVLDMGSSDWVVFPHAGAYASDEAYFLHFIIHTMDQALKGHPGLEADHFERWIAERHAQIERAELVYIAHQIDYVGRLPAIHAPQP